jgi:uncharacterized SAM-binding protein YcdF (DUF218 family)
MFFILSKILSFLITPLVWVVIFLVVSLIIKDQKKSKKFLITGVCILFFFTNSFMAYEFIRLWEIPVQNKASLKTSYDVGIVLGGGMVVLDKKNDRLIFQNNTDRIIQAIDLYKSKTVKKLLLSSGSGSVKFRNMLEAVLLKKYLINIGIPQEDIIVDSTSDNTYQNAVNSAIILKRDFPKGNYLLITSAFHMKRSVKCFKKQGITADIYCTNKIAGDRRFDFDMLIIPDTEALTLWNKLLHEILGYFTYYCMGYI